MSELKARFHGQGGTPKNGWFRIVEHPIKMEDSGVPLFQETSIQPWTITYNKLCDWVNQQEMATFNLGLIFWMFESEAEIRPPFATCRGEIRSLEVFGGLIHISW